ncbi:MAG: tyrosine/phenylalanine carboxypeptidase domain-containing protein [Planctomycetaceae bacterium]
MSDDTPASIAFDSLAVAVCERISRNDRVRRNLPGEGRVRIDRQLPFLCVYRSPQDRDDTGARELVTTEAAYLFASGDPALHEGLVGLCSAIAAVVREHFGAFLLIEIWEEDDAPSQLHDRPGFQIITPELETLPTMIAVLEAALAEIAIQGRAADVTLVSRERVSPPGMEPLVPADANAARGTFVLGLAVRPVYRDPTTGRPYPLVLQTLRRQLATALRKGVFEFSGCGTADLPVAMAHYESLGPTALTQAARLADRLLCEVSSSFDFLMQVTPVNSEDAWREFRDGGFRTKPMLYYRPLPDHPNLLKRRLFEVPLEHIEDSTLAHLCGEKQDELDHQLAALRDRGTDHFLYASLQLYGGAEDSLVALAEEILSRRPAEPATISAGSFVAATEIAASARQEIDRYRSQMPEFDADVVVSDGVASGLMVAQDRLYISESARLRRERLMPLLHHEIGTHLLTYFNGRRQPLGLMYAGLAGYEPLQEGLAVLAEFLAGGLTASRLRTLAGRVLAVRSMTDGASFVEAFQQLHTGHDFSPRVAFTTVLRAFRAGGLTKDAIYLRGFQELLDYLRGGHDVEPLYVGKIGLHHVPYVRELRRRGVLCPPGVLPRFWEDPRLHERLEACRRSSVLELLESAE